MQSRIQEMKVLFKKVEIDSSVLDFAIDDVTRMPSTDITAGARWVEDLYSMFKVLRRIWKTQDEDTWRRYMTWEHLRDNSTFKMLDNECQVIVKYINKRDRPDVFKKTKRAKYAQSKRQKKASQSGEASQGE